MSVSRMEKLTVVLPHGDVDALLRRVMRLRAVSLERTEQTDEPFVPLADEARIATLTASIAEIEAALPPLTKRARRKKSLFRPVTEVSFADFAADGREQTARKIVEETGKILNEQSALRATLEAQRARGRALMPYFDLALPLDFAGTASTVLLLGSLPAGVRRAALDAAVEELALTVDILSEEPSGTYLAVICHKAEEERALGALAGLGFVRAVFDDAHGTAKRLYDACEREMRAVYETLERLENRLGVLAERLTDVEILADMERTALLAEESKRRIEATAKCAVLTGWCPVRERERVTSVLERFGAAYEFTPPAEGDDPPILLRNNAYARNFEWVLGMYSYPRYGKFDPTFVMSIFYFLIFGLMFADAGYGLLLMVACFGGVRWLKPREGMKRFLLMFGYCGISCVICGVLFGSYFGNFPLAFLENVVGVAPEHLPRLSLLPSTEGNVAILFDPLQNPMGFLVVSLAVGAVHLLAGMAVKAFLLCREGKWLDALFDIVTYWVLFAGIGVVFLHKTVGIILLCAGAGSIVLTHGRHAKHPLQKLTGGLLGLYDLIAYASDLLSYSRILALGLAAAVIGQVINILATMKGASFIGFLLMIVVFCIGHVLNLVINVLGTFVHTSRLQYIEFFGKFYEDGGRPFVPLAGADRYTADTSPEESAPEPTQINV